MAKQHRMALATALGLWCGLAPAAWQSAAMVHWALVAIAVLAVSTALRRLWTVAAYLRDH